jgi:hypothetical protein
MNTDFSTADVAKQGRIGTLIVQRKGQMTGTIEEIAEGILNVNPERTDNFVLHYYKGDENTITYQGTLIKSLGNSLTITFDNGTYNVTFN